MHTSTMQSFHLQIFCVIRNCVGGNLVSLISFSICKISILLKRNKYQAFSRVTRIGLSIIIVTLTGFPRHVIYYGRKRRFINKTTINICRIKYIHESLFLLNEILKVFQTFWNSVYICFKQTENIYFKIGVTKCIFFFIITSSL